MYAPICNCIRNVTKGIVLFASLYRISCKDNLLRPLTTMNGLHNVIIRCRKYHDKHMQKVQQGVLLTVIMFLKGLGGENRGVKANSITLAMSIKTGGASNI